MSARQRPSNWSMPRGLTEPSARGVLSVAMALVGLAVRPLHFLYDYAWFVGFFTAGMVYAALMKMSAPAGDKG